MKINLWLTSCLTLSFLLMTTTGYSDNTFAPNFPSDLSLKDGFYLGAAGGYDNYTMNYKINSVSVVSTDIIDPDILPSPPISLQFNQHTSANQGLGGIFAGYGRSFPQHKAYLGFEIFGHWTDAKSTSSALIENQSYVDDTDFPARYPGYYLSSQAIGSTFQVNNNYGFSIHPGIKLHQSNLLYVSLGYGLSTISVKQAINTVVSFQDKLFNVTPAGSFASNVNSSHTLGGFAYGLGIEQALYKAWSLRAEYLRTDYNDLKSKTMSSVLSTSDNRYLLGLIYHI